MSVVHDFNPVVEEGQVEKAGGILGRRRFRAALPPVGHGFARVFVDRDGNVTPLDGGATAGERYWGVPAGWLKVDVSEHEFAFTLPVQMPDGLGGYEVTLLVSARVTSPKAVVERNIRGVRGQVAPLLAALVGDALGAVATTPRVDTLSDLNSGQVALERSVRQSFPPGKNLSAADWLEVTVVSVNVAKDADTARHYSALVEARRSGDLEVTRLKHRQMAAVEQIQLQKTWAEHLGPLLHDPLLRAVETIAADPTAENIDRVVQRLDASDQWTRTEVVAILNRLIEKDFVGDVSELEAIKTIVDNLQTARSQNRPRLPVPEQAKALDGQGVIDLNARPAPADSGAGVDESDKSW